MEWFKKLWSHPQKFGEQDWVRAQVIAKELVEVAQLKPGTKILDMACGQGLTTIALSLFNFQIEGRDYSQPMLDFAAEHCKEHKVKVQFSCQDMRTVTDQQTFDVVMLRDVIWGIFDKETNRDLLRRLKTALKPNGKIILEVYNKSAAIEQQPLEGFLTVDLAMSRLTGKAPSQNGGEETTISVEILSSSEWLEVMSKIGFSNVQVVPILPYRKKGLDAASSLINLVIGTN